MSRSVAKRIALRLEREEGAVRKDPGGRTNVALVFPNRYRVGMSNLGFQGVYALLNQREDALCERAFYPDPEDLPEFEKDGAPIRTYESGRPLKEFDVIAFSVAYENDYPRVAEILRLSGLSPRARERTPHDPLVLLGGVCLTYNPEPLAPFADVIMIGEAEVIVGPFFDLLRGDPPRPELEEQSVSLPGVYWPSRSEPVYDDDGRLVGRKGRPGDPARVRKGFLRSLDGSTRRTTVFTPETEFADMCLVEASRGCPWGCNFCVAGSVYLPVRHRSPSDLSAEIEAGRPRRHGVVAPSPSDYPGIEGLLRTPGVRLSISSVRARSKTAEIVSLLADRGQKSVSIAPEAGSERLRRVIRKRLSEAEILETASRIAGTTIGTLRLYFMVGLPTETDADAEAIAVLAGKVRGVFPRGKIALSVSCFVPKPWTAFQWEAFAPVDLIKRRLNIVRRGISTLSRVTLRHETPRAAAREALLARGDRRMADVIESLARGRSWREALRGARLDQGAELGPRDPEDFLPWDFIDLGIAKETLRRRARRSRESG